MTKEFEPVMTWKEFNEYMRKEVEEDDEDYPT